MAKSPVVSKEQTVMDLNMRTPAKPVDPADVAKKAEYRRRLAEKLKDPEFRKIEGFPIGTDEAILALSDPPHYTACPNPFLEEWLAEHAKPYDAATDSYHREPFAADVSEGKNDPIYNAHSYHTKVPHKAIMRYILHYTQPGDVVYDGFCGTGMTGVAAQLCGDKEEVEALRDAIAWDSKGKATEWTQAYFVDSADQIWDRFSWAAHLAVLGGGPVPMAHLREPRPFSKLGPRKAILNDLSPAATSIAYNYNTPVDAVDFSREAMSVLKQLDADCGWMYTTLKGLDKADVDEWAQRLAGCRTMEEAKGVVDEIPTANKTRIQYLVWTDVMQCPDCGERFEYWATAVESDIRDVKDNFACPGCCAALNKDKSQRRQREVVDRVLGRTVVQSEQAVALINYGHGRARAEKHPDAFDAALVAVLGELEQPGFPSDQLPHGYNTSQPARTHGLTHVHHFFYARTRSVLERYLALASSSPLRRQLLFLLTSFLLKTGSKLHNIGLKDGAINLAGAIPNVLAVNAAVAERNIILLAEGKVSDLTKAFTRRYSMPAISTSSSTANGFGPCADYIFVDPPFGGNLMYSELNFIAEAVLGAKTSNHTEAITNPVQGKGLPEYFALAAKCFGSFYNALKPGHWMTVEFHNSSNAVWNAIREAIELSGFVIGDVRVLDKLHYTHKQVTSTGAMKRDLVISCYKPSTAFQADFQQNLGKPAAIQAFLDQHLAMLPVAPVTKTLKIERLAERTTSLLYDRMIAYHLVRGAAIPLSATEFSRLLAEHYIDRDGMWFLPGQEAKYDALKMRGVETEQLSLYVQDEKSAIGWLRAELKQQPQTQGELTPKFMQACKEWPKNETRPELIDLLKDSFIPTATGLWQLPDPDNEEHVAQLRQTTLLKVFKGYSDQALTAGRTTKLAGFRTEAMLEGFKYCWQTDQFAVIVAVAARLKPDHLQSHPELMLLVDLAKDRAGEAEPATQLAFVWE